MDSSMEEKVTNELIIAASKREILGKSLNEMQSKWKDLEEQFESMEKSIEKRVEEVEKSAEKRSEEVEAKEKRLRTIQKVIFQEVEVKGKEFDERKSGFEEREKEVESKEKSVEKRSKEVEWIQKRLEVKRKAIDVRNEEVEFREKQFESVRETIGKRFDELEKEEERLCLMGKSIDERLMEVDLKEREFDVKQKVIEEKWEEVQLKDRELVLIQKSIEERLVEVELKESELDMKQKAVEEQCEAVQSKGRELVLMQKLIEERLVEVELKESELDVKRKAVEEQCEAVQSKDRELVLMQKSIEEKLVEVELKESELNVERKAVEEQCEAVQSKDRELVLIQKSIEEKLVEVELKESELNVERKAVEEQCEAVQSKEKELVSIQQSIEKRLQEVALKEERVNAVGSSNEERLRELELQAEMITESLKELESKQQLTSIQRNNEESLNELEQRINNLIQESTTERSQVKSGPSESCGDDNLSCSSNPDLQFSVSMDGKTLQMFLNQRFTGCQSLDDEVFVVIQTSSDPAKLVLDAMQGFYPPHLKEDDVEFEATIIRKSCILLLQQLMRVSPPLKPHVQEAAMNLAGEWKSKMRLESENSLEVLGFLLLVATYRLTPCFNLEELLNLWQILDEHGQSPELCQALGFADKAPLNGSLQTQLRTEQPEVSLVNNAVDSSSANLFSATMHISMQLLLNEHIIDETLMSDSVYDVLQSSPNPAKLVLEALEFYRLRFKERIDNHKESDIRSCILLLERLMTFSPEIKPEVKEEAMKLAVEWKAELRVETQHSMEVLIFLQLLAAYGLVSDFSGEEVLILFKAVAQHKEAPKLCRDLGFADKITDYIKFLVGKKEQLKAIRYICAFKLDKELPIVPLMEDHLKVCKNVSKRILKEENNSLVAQDKAADKEIAALRVVIKFVEDQQLESSFALEEVEKRIIKLEKEKEKRRKTVVPSPVPKSQPQPKSGDKRQIIAVSAEAAPSTSNSNASLEPAGSSANIIIELEKEKENRTGTAVPSPASAPKSQPQPKSGDKWQRIAVSAEAAPSTSNSKASLEPADSTANSIIVLEKEKENRMGTVVPSPAPKSQPQPKSGNKRQRIAYPTTSNGNASRNPAGFSGNISLPYTSRPGASHYILGGRGGYPVRLRQLVLQYGTGIAASEGAFPFGPFPPPPANFSDRHF